MGQIGPLIYVDVTPGVTIGIKVVMILLRVTLVNGVVASRGDVTSELLQQLQQ